MVFCAGERLKFNRLLFSYRFPHVRKEKELKIV